MSGDNPERFITILGLGRRKYHVCIRCDRAFLCPDSDTCKAGVNVSPRLFVKGKLMAHCPEHPDWNWIRAQIGEALRCDSGAEWHGIPTHEHEFFEIESDWGCKQAEIARLRAALQAVMKHVYCENDYTSREYEDYYAALDLAKAALAETPAAPEVK